MKQLLLTVTAALLSASSFSQQTNETINIQGVTRNFIQYLPTGFNQASESLPVVFVLHGIGGTASGMTPAGTNLIADTARFICVYPQGMNNFQGQASWANGTGLQSTANDLGLFNQLIDKYITDFNADPSKIYVTGLSMGSIMSYTLACQLNDRIAAIGAMSGPMSTNDLNTCVPTYVTPVMHVHGTADDVVPYDANPLPTLSLVPETIDFWKNAHNCASADSTQLPNIANDGFTVDRFVYAGCTTDKALELWRVNGGGHTYFFQPFNDFTEAIEIWLFLRKWSHPSPAAVGLETHTLAETVSIAPNPSNGSFTLTVQSPGSVSVKGINGKTIETIALVNGENKLNLKGIATGIYLLEFMDGSTKRISIQ